ncbi:MAG: putative Methicillin resistance protein [Candidatus Saccharibacteria bacterium]|nr:putative Methicillin resistance protein [Candidatus Saccharibacteria bacterium]
MTMRLADSSEIDNWNTKILGNPDGGDVLQSVQFAHMREMGNWKPRYVLAGSVALTILEKPVAGLGNFWYIPKGPGISTVPQLGDLLPDLRSFADKHGVFAVKVEPELEKTDDAMKALHELGLKHVAAIQPNASTVLIDLGPKLDEIMAGLNQKGRHAIKRAERDGVTVERVKATDKNCEAFYELLQQTASGSFIIRPYDYFKKLWQSFASAEMGQLFFANYDGKLVAAAFAMVFGEKSTYKDGASVRERTAYGASHLLQWHIIAWAKERGAKQHNLYGSPSSDQINDEQHPYYGVGRFKTSFNKHVTDYVGAFDLVVRPRQYALWIKFGERAAKSLWWRSRHESWY